MSDPLNHASMAVERQRWEKLDGQRKNESVPKLTFFFCFFQVFIDSLQPLLFDPGGFWFDTGGSWVGRRRVGGRGAQEPWPSGVGRRGECGLGGGSGLARHGL